MNRMRRRRGRASGLRRLTLSGYVLARNGVPLGGRGSLENMLKRSLGAASFADFWRFWNPIWGYYLGRYVFRLSTRVLPYPLALILTFLVSGGIHDLVTTAVRGSPTLLFTPWFFLMSIGVLLGRVADMDLAARPWAFRFVTNLTYVGTCLLAAQRFRL